MHYHFIGIGGVGMSAIAQILHNRGESVSGSDRGESDVTRRLRAAGIVVSIGHDAGNVNGAEVVIFTPAIAKDNPELLEAKRRGLPLMERPEMLGRLMEPYKHRVAIAGTHGKTTTTSMTDMVLERAGLDFTTLIGGDLKSLGGNARIGSGDTIVTEACEAFGSFQHLRPSITVILNVEPDHLDYYGTPENVEKGFKQFIDKVDPDGVVIACADDPGARRVLDGCDRRVVWFGTDESADVRAVDVDVAQPDARYTLVRDGVALGAVTLGVPGMQNVTDSLAAAAVAFELGAGFEPVRDALKDFHGAGRRFEILYDDGSVMVVDDYAHHPSEIRATLSGVKSAFSRRLIAVFQPHLYSRTRDFCAEFAEALSLADAVIVTPIYAAREQPIEGISGENIVECLEQVGYGNMRYARDKDILHEELAKEVRGGDIVMVLGAGDIRVVGERLAAKLAEGVTLA